MANIKVKNKQTREFQFKVPESFSAEDASFDAVIASEAPVLVMAPDGSAYYEILSCRSEHVDLSRVTNGAPILDFHYKGGWRSQLGVTSNPLMESGQISASIMLSDRDELKDLVRDISRGIIKNMSAGYSVYKYTDLTKPGDKIPTLRADSWRINEVSFAPVNADGNSRIRSENEPEYTEIQINTMEPDVNTPVIPVTPPVPVTPAPATTPAPAAPPAPAPAPVEAPGPAAERTRALEIVNIAHLAMGKVPATFAAEQIASTNTVDQVRALAFTAMATAAGTQNQGGLIPAQATPGHIQVNLDQIEKTRALMEIGIARRYNVAGTYTNEEIVASERYRSMHMIDMVRDYVDKAGDNSILHQGMQKVGERSMISTSSYDFPVILEGVARRVLLNDYAILADTWRAIAATGSVSDFRDWGRVRGGSMGNLDRVNENGEYKNKAIPDGAKEIVNIKTYGNTVNITRQAIINDDLDYFFRITGQMGRMAARSIEQSLYDLINSNVGLGPTMSDGYTLIHANHGNVGPSGAYSATTVAAARDRMKLQKDLSNNDWLNLSPSLIWIPTGISDTVKSLNINDYTNEANIYEKKSMVKGLFNTIIDSPRFVDANRVYLLADKNIEPVFEVNFLNGQQTPFMDERTTFGVDGLQWKIRIDYGVNAIGYRGIVSMPGV